MCFLAYESCDFAVVTALLIRFPADATSALGQTIVDVRLGEGQVVSVTPVAQIECHDGGTIPADCWRSPGDGSLRLSCEVPAEESRTESSRWRPARVPHQWARTVALRP